MWLCGQDANERDPGWQVAGVLQACGQGWEGPGWLWSLDTPDDRWCWEELAGGRELGPIGELGASEA